MTFDVAVREADSGAEQRRGDLLLVLGWGNRHGHAPVEWLLDGLADDGWTVHAVTLAENGTDFHRDYVEPVARVRADVDPAVSAGHSLGGLTLAHLPGDDPRIYSSPFWGFEATGLRGLLLPAVSRIPSEKRMVPLRDDRAAIGDLKPTDERTATEDGASPAWLSTIRTAHRTLPPFRPGSVVYCSLTDRVVSTRAIGRRTPAPRVRLYDGGHEFFASTGRGSTLERFCEDLAAVSGG